MDRNVNSRFSMLPGVEIQRSSFDRPHQHKTTLNAGELVPIFVDEVLPGDTFSLDMSSLVRMSTPIFPVMDNAFLDTYFFFVPNRLVWEHWKEFNGENSQGYWTQNIEYSVPTLTAPDGSGDVSNYFGWSKGSLADYFGIPTNVGNITVNHLPFRAYTLIWNEWFRDQNTMPPAYFNKSDNNYLGADIKDVYITDETGDEPVTRLDYDLVIQNALFGAKPLPVSKFHDYFTSTLPSPQKGPAVDLPLYQDSIPVFSSLKEHGPNIPGSSSVYPLKFATASGDPVDGTYSLGISSGRLQAYNGPTNTGLVASLSPTNLYADVSNVAVATISQLRQAFQLQRLYERDARGGTRYIEILKSHFGVDSPDSRLQRPEYLGGKRIPINIDQVLQTSSTDSVTPQGNTAAYSLTIDKSSTFTKSFTEHGYIIGVACIRTEHTYQQGIERFWSRKNRFDFYWPTLAHLSEQAVLVKEIYAEGNEHDDDAFGYQEAWADYRYKPSRVSGAFRSNYAQTLDSWHYADYYTGGNDNFVLSAPWLIETKDNIDRTLAVSSSIEDQFLCDFYFDLKCVRPMPLYSVPGLVDHF